MPEIKWVGSPNFYHGRTDKTGKTHTVLAIVDHIMCGTEVGTDTWFQNPQSQVSAHYGVMKDGTIHQYVKDEDTAWAVGIVDKPNWPLFDQTGGHPNYSTISIEHEGQPTDKLTDAQYQSTLWLHLELVKKFNLTVDSMHIIGHNQLDSVTRKDCPGPNFPWAKLFADLELALHPVPTDMSAGYSGFTADVEWGWQNGLLGVYGDNTIKPQDFMTREQSIHMLHQYHLKNSKGELK